MKKSLLFFCLISAAVTSVNAQTLLNENVNYQTGALTNALSGANVSGGNWISLATAGAPLMVPATGLSYTGYGSSGIGNSISMVNTPAFAEDAYRQFPAQITGTTYCALLVKVTDTIGLAPYPNTTTPDYFTGFITNSTAQFSRLYIRKGSAGNTYQLGIKGNTANFISFAQQDLNADSTTLIVFAYSTVTGNNNDSVRLWINPSTTSALPSADAKSIITSGGDASDISRVFLRQGTGTPNCLIDGIHVGRSWPDVLSSAPGPVAPANAIQFIPTGFTTLSFSWTRPGDYNPVTMQTVAFLKKTSPLTIGTPTVNPSVYVADTDFSGSGTAYQNDPLAKCVLNSDSNTVNLSGLTIASGYYLSVFIVRTDDSVYANAVAGLGTTQANKPAPVTSAFFTTTSFTSTILSWIKPAGYIDSNMTVLVFLKQTTTVVPKGTIDANPSIYIPNQDFSQNGTRFVNDTTAKCIYNGDSNTVSITGLLIGTTYYANFYVVRSSDSNYYSNLVFSVVATTSQPGSVTALNINPTGQTSATAAWTRPSGYNPATMTTLVFLKEKNAIQTVVHPDKNPSGYTANSDFSSTSTLYQHDSLARCVMNSDSNFVNITGLLSDTTYHVLVYVVRSSDSVYSIESTAYGKTYGSVLPPLPLKAVSLKANGTSVAMATWTKDSSFIDTADVVLVFLKKGSTVTQGAPNLNPNQYTANIVFANGTSFQNDTAAKCIYKGTGTTVTVSGLQPATTYFMVTYIVRAGDSLYSSAKTASAGTASAPVTSISVVGQSGTSTKITWTKPAGYVNSSYSTLVFVKSDNAINVGTPTRPQAIYFAVPALGSGTKYQHDPLAYCVFKADTNFVTITNLVQSKNYEVLILVIRDVDSVYSVAATAAGTTLPAPAAVTIGSVNTTNAITGNPDSLGVRVTLRGVTYGTNQVTSGLKFLLRDATGGITVISNGPVFSYIVTEGDSIEVQGSISTTRGLLCITIDTLSKKATGKTIQSPDIVTALNETTENNLLQVNKVKFLTSPGTTWFATTYQCVVDGTSDTIAVRITTGSGLPGKAVPGTKTFSVIGVGGQVSSSINAPFPFNGYQILPRTVRDIILPDTLGSFTLIAPQANDTLILSDTTTMITFNWGKAKSFSSTAATYTLMLDTFPGNFTTPVFEIPSMNAGNDSLLSLTSMALSNLLILNPFVTYKAIWKVRATLGSYTGYSNSNPIYITRQMFTGIQTSATPASFELYPNPASHIVFIRYSEPVQAVVVSNQLGQVVLKQYANNREVSFATEGLKRGIYFVSIETATGAITQKLIVN
ncbi:MAG: T9SS type A sorting domain-containing protein [Bacteroidota bacterium]